MTLLLALLLWQGGPSLTASVDRDRVSVGDEVVLTVRAVSHSVEPMQVSLAPMNGFEIIGRSEQTEVSTTSGPQRTTTLEIQLRALRPGAWPLGPVRARQGQQILQTGDLKVVVSSTPGTSTATALSPRVRRVLERAPPPSRPGKAAVAVLTSADTVYVGEQVDVVTAAWFPRDLRSQLRRPPTLQPPTAEGVWSYPQPVPPGIAASRRVGGTWYDLFVMHQVIFPLVPGQLRISEASLRYSVPVAMQFFSQEDHFTLASKSVALTVVALPEAGEPAGFAGAVGRSLTVARSIRPAAARAGEALSVDVAVGGRGNVALWPTPELRWPTGLRAYTDKMEDRLETVGGILGGTKMFRNLAVPDSAGVLVLPELTYPYFDLDTRSYRVAGAPRLTIPVAPAPEGSAARALPPPLMVPSGAPLARRIARGVPLWLWLTLLGAPPLVVVGRAARGRRRLPSSSVAKPDPAGADRRLQSALRALVPDVDRYSGRALIAALRAAGIDPAVASRVSRAREAYLAARYGPSQGTGPGLDAVVRELDQLTAALGATSLRGPRRTAATAALLVMFATAAHGQTNPEQLYRSGSIRAAAEGFLRRAHAEPDVAAHWYDLGAAYYRLGAEGPATAAWLRAARLVPRSPTVRRALELVPASDDESERREWTAPVTAEELGLAAGVCWLIGWTFLLQQRRVRTRVIAALGASLVLAAGAIALRTWYVRPLAVVVESGPLRLSPHGRAPEVVTVKVGAAVRPVRAQGGWWLVRAPDGREGWIAIQALVPVNE